MTEITIPNVGTARPTDNGDYVTEPLSVVFLGSDTPFTIEDNVIEALDAGDITPEDLARCINNFRDVSQPVLDIVAPDLFAYFKDVEQDLDPDEDYIPEIPSASVVWDYATIDDSEPSVHYNKESSTLFVTLEGEVEWEEEHGLLLVFEDGARISKLGPFDGLTLPYDSAEPHPDGTGVYFV